MEGQFYQYMTVIVTRAWHESTSHSKVTASNNYMLGLNRHAVKQCPYTY